MVPADCLSQNAALTYGTVLAHGVSMSGKTRNDIMLP